MPTALEKARQAPDSMKARILSAARKLFGEYGFHGVTTRMIAKEVGIDISTLHYHWGEKQELYEAVLTDLSDEIRAKLVDIEALVHGKPLAVRLEVAIDVMCDHLFGNPESANLMLFSYFSKNRLTSDIDVRGEPVFGKIAEEHQVGRFGVAEEVIAHDVDGHFEAHGQGLAMHQRLDIHQLGADLVAQIGQHRFVQLLFFTPMVVEGGDVDAHLLGDHARGYPVKTIFAEQLACGRQDPGFHRIGRLARLFKSGGHGRTAFPSLTTP